MAQDLLVKLGYPLGVHGPGQEVRESLVPPRSGAVSGRAVFVERDEVVRAFLSVPVEVGGVSVVPVFLKLLPEDALGRQLLLQKERKRSQQTCNSQKSSEETSAQGRPGRWIRWVRARQKEEPARARQLQAQRRPPAGSCEEPHRPASSDKSSIKP